MEAALGLPEMHGAHFCLPPPTPIVKAVRVLKSCGGPSRITGALCLLSGAVDSLASCGNEFLLGFDFHALPPCGRN